MRVVARRAGRTPTGPLEAAGDCTFTGSVQVDDPGRWFVHTEVIVAGRQTEAWLPVEHGARRKDTVLYVAAGDGPHVIQARVAGSARSVARTPVGGSSATEEPDGARTGRSPR